MGGTQNVSFLGRRYFKLPILSCSRIPPATQASGQGALACRNCEICKIKDFFGEL